MGMGDGDVVQRLIEFCIGCWKNKLSPVKIHIIGIDLNFFRVENAKNCSFDDENITFEFHQGDFVGNNLNYLKSTLISQSLGVFEILDDIQFDRAIKEIARVTKKGIYIEDLFETFPEVS